MRIDENEFYFELLFTKKYIITILMVTMFFLLNNTLVVNASEINFVDMSLDLNASSPNYQDVCHGLPYHKMYANGWCTVYRNGSTYIASGCLWKCEYCRQVLVTQGDKYSFGTDPIGKYATYVLADGESLTHLNYIFNAAYYGYTNAKELSTYKRLFRG